MTVWNYISFYQERTSHISFLLFILQNGMFYHKVLPKNGKYVIIYTLLWIYFLWLPNIVVSQILQNMLLKL